MKYPIFTKALALTIVVFVVGLYLGIVLEDSRLDKIGKYYLESEISLMDILSLNNLAESSGVSCEVLKEANFELVDRVYEEARLLEEYERTGRLSEEINDFHKKYDVLRTYLWIDAVQIRERCDNFNTVVYIYNNSNEDLAIKAKQNAWSNILYDLKEVEKENILLISLDIGADLVSLNSILKNYQVEKYPVVIINEEEVFEVVSGVNEIRLVLK
jgi:hypothetical protein